MSRRRNINVLKIWIACQPTLQNVPNRDTQKKVKGVNKKQVKTIDYDYDWI